MNYSIGKTWMRLVRVGTLAALVCGGRGFADMDAVTGAQSIFNHGKVESGFCAHILPKDIAVSLQLHNNQKMLVHALFTDHEKWLEGRRKATEEGLYGLISADFFAGLEDLPYGDNQVNLSVIGDWSAAVSAGLTPVELYRVAAPGGAIAVSRPEMSTSTQDIAGLLGSAGFGEVETYTQGSETVILAKKAVPEGMDRWTHREYGPEGNALSSDKVEPPRYLKWTSGDETYGKDQHAGFRTDNGRVVYYVAGDRDLGTSDRFVGRDVFSGVQLWTKSANLGKLRQKAYVMNGDRFYCFLNGGGDLVALDAATGDVVKTYVGLPEFSDINNVEILYVNGYVLGASNGYLIAWDAESAEKKWEYNSGRQLQFIAASTDRSHVYAAIGSCEVRSKNRWRLFSFCLESIKALKLEDGSEVWENTDQKGGSLGQLVYYDGYLGLFSSSAISGGSYRSPTDDFIGVLNADDGTLLWQDRFNPEGSINNFGYSLLIRDSLMFVPNPNGFRIWDIETGLEKSKWKVGKEGDYPKLVQNQRCHRSVATNDYMLAGYVTWVDRDWNFAFEPIRRSSCATPGFPTYNQLLLTPTECTCYSMLHGGKGYLSLSNDGDERLVEEDGYRFTSGKTENMSTSVGVLRKAVAAQTALNPQSPIVSDWPEAPMPEGMGKRTVRTIRVGEGSFKIDQINQIVEASHPSYPTQELWVGGRVTTDPLLIGSLAVIGARDGYVYAYDLAEQKRAWRFLAAPFDRRIVASGRLESTWPVSSIESRGDTLVVQAGTSPNLVGGIFHYGIQADSGALLWKKREIDFKSSPYEETSAPIIENIPIGRIPDLNNPAIAVETSLNVNVRERALVFSTTGKSSNHTKWRIVDVSGRTIVRGNAHGKNLIEVPYTGFAPGMYFYTVRFGRETKKGTFLIN